MNREDDPEARIRQLEQPLADAARASELGRNTDAGYQDSGYQYPPPPPGPVPPPMSPSAPSYGSYNAYSGYSSPFPGATPRSSSGMRVFWILAGVFVLIALGAAGAIAVYVSKQMNRDDFSMPSTVSQTFYPSTSGPAGGKTPADGKTGAPTTEPSTSPAPAAGSKLTISGINEKKTVACDNNVVTVSGMSNTIVITGHCASLTVSGMRNAVTIDSADTITASGFDNQITYHSGSPQISKFGDNNMIEQG